MPIFEYECKKCGQVTEVLENANGNGKHECRKCGSKRMEKLFSSFAARNGTSSSSSSCSTGTCPTAR